TYSVTCPPPCPLIHPVACEWVTNQQPTTGSDSPKSPRIGAAFGTPMVCATRHSGSSLRAEPAVFARTHPGARTPEARQGRVLRSLMTASTNKKQPLLRLRPVAQPPR